MLAYGIITLLVNSLNNMHFMQEHRDQNMSFLRADNTADVLKIVTRMWVLLSCTSSIQITIDKQTDISPVSF